MFFINRKQPWPGLAYFISMILLPLVIFTACSGKVSDYRYIGFFPGEGIKGYDGGSWHGMSEGLPKDLEAEYITSDSKGTLYLTTEYSGLFRRSVNDSKWMDISSPSFKRRTQLKDVNEYRTVSAFCVDPSDERKLYLATKHTLYRSDDSGKNWQKVSLSENKNSYYFTSLMVSGNALYAGTSFNGIIRITPGSTREINSGIPKEYYAGKFNFCEEVSALASGKDPVYSGYLFGRGMAESYDRENWRSVNIPVRNEKTEGVYGISIFKELVYVSTSENIYTYNTVTKNTGASPLYNEIVKSCGKEGPSMLFVRGSDENPPLFIKRNTGKYRMEEESRSGNKQALYVNWGMIEKNFRGFLNIVVRNKFNAVVIDIKDDFGIINAPVESKTARELGAIKNTDIKNIIKQLHEKGIYVIARNVTFKDKKLYEAWGGKYAILDRSTNRPWVGLPREKWCDPYSKFVRDYNIEIAKETAKLGFDEIQFDYIRFPTDGPVLRCLYRYREKDDTFKSEIMADFLQQARKECGVPVSIDIYGYNAWYKFGNLIGQDLKYLARFTDAVYPMVYPSHFGPDFYTRYSPADRPYRIVRDSAVRAICHSKGRTVIRLWIQDWNYNSPTWGPGYILKQVQGVLDGGGKSYSFWNPGGDHSMADRAFGGR